MSACGRFAEVSLSSDLAPGSVFAERYRIERRIASGGMGAVYEVVHLETNRRRALKILHANLVQSEELRSRFRQEARVAAEIESEHIVDVFDAGIDAATEMPFLVMELLRGEDVRQRIKRAGPMPFDETVRILLETAVALDKTHQARIVHRDLKPDNIYLCERELGPPRAKVLDFGIAKLVADGTMSGQTRESIGTPLYMAPEQFLMSTAVSSATDIFALGLIAYTMLVGKPYWLEETLRAGAAVAFAMHACKGPQESAVKRAETHGITLPPSFDAWFFRMCAPRAEDRYQVATTAIADLAQVLGVANQVDAAPISIPGSSTTSNMRITLNSGIRASAVLAAAGLSLTPIPASQSSVPDNQLQPVLTPIGSGLTNAPPTTRRPIAAIAAGVSVGVVLIGFLGYLALSGSSTSTTAEPASPVPASSASAVVAEPAVTPASTPEPRPEVSAAPEPPPTAATPTKSTKSTKSTNTANTRPTGTVTTKKTSSGGNIWNND